MKQNIYNNLVFFESYKDLRDNDRGLNGDIELPSFRKLIDNIENAIVLDLGCGFGQQIQYLLDKKAKEVIGVDISERMITEAKTRIQSRKVTFVCRAIEDYDIENKKYDIVLSSMTFHYIMDLVAVFKNIYCGLKPGGQFIFSIEHPICTALLKSWIDTEDGKIWPVAHYSQEGIRYQDWFVSGVTKYHRKISSIINALIDIGFDVKKIEEPEPDNNVIIRKPELRIHIERPAILIVKAEK